MSETNDCRPMRAEPARGLHHAVARRAVAMLGRLPVKDEIVFCGGGALNACLRELVSRALAHQVYLPPEPQIVAALGAALSVGSDQGQIADRESRYE